MANNKYHYHPEGVGDFLESPSPDENGWVITYGENLEEAIANLPIPQEKVKAHLKKVEELKKEYEEDAQTLEDIDGLTCGQGWEFFIIAEEFWDDYIESFE